MFLADGVILTKAAAQGAARKKDGSTSPASADTGFFPVMEGSAGCHDSICAAAVSSASPAVNVAVSGTQTA